MQWSELAAERLAPTVERIAELLANSWLQHADETGIRVYGMLHWLHVNSTRWLTHLASDLWLTTLACNSSTSPPSRCYLDAWTVGTHTNVYPQLSLFGS